MDLDCTRNKAAEELLLQAIAEQSKHTGYIPTRNVQLKGRLEFRDCIRVVYDAMGKQIEHPDTFPVIVVESLKIVE